MKTPTHPTPDITVDNCGSIFLFIGDTTAGQEWLEDNLQQATLFGDGFAVEHRYAFAIVEGAKQAGLEVL